MFTEIKMLSLNMATIKYLDKHKKQLNERSILKKIFDIELICLALSVIRN